MVQQILVAVIVVACSLWLLWNVILPARAKRALTGREPGAGGGCHGCALSEKGCPSATASPDGADRAAAPVHFHRR